MESPHGAARRRGFTLVELLVVISVIVILAALVLPVASSAMKTAARAECTSNLHQVAEGFMIYVKEHRGLMPPSGSPNRNPPPILFGPRVAWQGGQLPRERTGRAGGRGHDIFLHLHDIS